MLEIVEINMFKSKTGNGQNIFSFFSKSFKVPAYSNSKNCSLVK